MSPFTRWGTHCDVMWPPPFFPVDSCRSALPNAAPIHSLAHLCPFCTGFLSQTPSSHRSAEPIFAQWSYLCAACAKLPVSTTLMMMMMLLWLFCWDDSTMQQLGLVQPGSAFSSLGSRRVSFVLFSIRRRIDFRC